MDTFFSTYRNRVDQKGRVSVPAPFRTILAREGLEGVYCYPSLDLDALEAGGHVLLEANRALTEQLDPYSDEKTMFSAVFFGESTVLKLDGEGRMVLPDGLKSFAGITNEVMFVGMGDKFLLWNPGTYDAYRKDARAKVREMKRVLGRSSRLAGEAPAARPGEARE